MLADIWLVTRKDLRIEWRSRVTLSQVVPFALTVLIMFGFAFDANRSALRSVTSGLFWLTVLFVTVVAVQRSTALETADSARRSLLLAGIEPAAVFLGKALAISFKILMVEVLLVAGVMLLYDVAIKSLPLLLATCVLATVGVSASGTLLGALVAGVRSRETLLPILLLVVLAPVLIAASRAFDDALGLLLVDGWTWLGLLAGFSVINALLGTLCYGVLLEET